MNNSPEISKITVDKKKSTERQTKRIRVGFILVVGILLIYIPSLLHWLYGKNIKTDILRNGKLDNSIEVMGLLVRDEQTILCSKKGKLILEAAEGERLPANARIVTVLQDESQALMNNLDELNLKIITQQNKKSSAQGIFSDDIKKVDYQIDDKVSEIVKISNSGKYYAIGQTCKDINEIIIRRSSLLGEFINNDSSLNLLYQQRDKIERKIKQSTSAIYTSKPGIISFVIDGYENILRPDKIESINDKIFNEIAINKLKSENSEASIIAKIIYGIDCNIAVLMNENQASKFIENDIVKLRINDIGNSIDNVKVVSKFQKPSGKYLIVFSISRFLNETSSMRELSIEVVLDEHEGIKVPLNCLFNSDTNNNTADIFVVKANIVYLKKVKIIVKNEEYAIIEGTTENRGGEGTINLYDYYVCNPENIEEGQIMKQ